MTVQQLLESLTEALAVGQARPDDPVLGMSLDHVFDIVAVGVGTFPGDGRQAVYLADEGYARQVEAGHNGAR